MRKPLEKELAKIEKLMAQQSLRIEQIDALIADESFYSDERREERVKTLAEHGELSAKQAKLEEQWLELSSEIEDLS